MEKIVDFSKPVSRLIKDYPETIKILKDFGFNKIDKKFAQATIGKITSINKGAKIKKIPIDKVEEAFLSAGFKITNKE